MADRSARSSFWTLGSFFFFLCGADALGEQSLFNVPSSEITHVGQTFFQEQLAYGNSVLQSNSTFCYGLPGNMEIGIDLLNFDLNFAPAGSFFVMDNSFLVANFQKGFEIDDAFRLGIGGQAGANLVKVAGKISPLALVYINTVTKLFADRLRLYLGMFWGSSHYLGQEQANVMAGIEIPLWREKLHFVADTLRGNHGFGVSVIGLTYFPWKDFALSAGLQLPNAGTTNPTAAVVELTWQ